MGNHNIGVKCLEYLIEQGEDIRAVFALPDRRKEIIWYKSVKETALKHGIPVYQPRKVSSPTYVRILRRIKPDIIFSISWRQMLSREILEIPKMGCINLHGSLLPKYRGFTPVIWAIINGEKKTGVTLHYMNEKPDAGDIIAQKEVEISPEDTGKTLYDKITEAGLQLFKETFPKIKNGTASRIPQNEEEATYFGRRKPEDGIIDWNKSSIELYNWVRALMYPYPGAFTYIRGRKLYIWWAEIKEKDGILGKPGEIIGKEEDGVEVACGKGSILLKSVQLGGKEYTPISPVILLNENKLKTGEIFRNIRRGRK